MAAEDHWGLVVIEEFGAWTLNLMGVSKGACYIKYSYCEVSRASVIMSSNLTLYYSLLQFKLLIITITYYSMKSLCFGVNYGATCHFHLQYQQGSCQWSK